MDGEDQDPGGEKDHAGQREVVHRALGDDEAEHDGGDHRSGNLGQVEDADVQRAVVAGQRRGREDRGRHRRGRGEQRHRDPRDGHRAREHRANRQERSLGAVLVDDQDDDRRQAAEQRHDHHGIEEAVARELRGAEERGHTTNGRQRDRRQVPRRVGIGGRRVLERQHGQHQGRDRDPGDDPEQRPPRVCLRLQSPDERAERDGAEDAHVHDHRRVAQLVAPDSRSQAAAPQRSATGWCTAPGSHDPRCTCRDPVPRPPGSSRSRAAAA